MPLIFNSRKTENYYSCAFDSFPSIGKGRNLGEMTKHDRIVDKHDDILCLLAMKHTLRLAHNDQDENKMVCQVAYMMASWYVRYKLTI